MVIQESISAENTKAKKKKKTLDAKKRKKNRTSQTSKWGREAPRREKKKGRKER